jgi:cob(I)alamin adenosyltransferase
LNDAGELPDATILHYLNRASDAVYAMARYADEPDPKLFEGRN